MNKYSIKEKWLHQYLHIWADSGIDIDKLAEMIDKSTHPEKNEMHGEILEGLILAAYGNMKQEMDLLEDMKKEAEELEHQLSFLKLKLWHLQENFKRHGGKI